RSSSRASSPARRAWSRSCGPWWVGSSRGSRASAAHGVLAGDDARGFLTGGLVLVEVAQVRGDLAAQLPHGLRPELPGTVGGREPRSGRGGQGGNRLGGP